MKKLERYAAMAEKAKAKARAEIKKMESQGFSVSDGLRDLAESKTPEKITQRTYVRLSKQLNLNNVRRTSKLLISEISKESLHRDISPIKSDITYADYISSTRLARKVNSLLNVPLQITDKEKRPIKSEDLSRKISLVMSSVMGSAVFPKPGMSNEFFEISKDYDPKDPMTLSEHIKFKKIPLNENSEYYVKLLTQQPYTNPELYNEYREDASQRGYFKNMKDTKIDPQTAERLAWLLNSSHLWNIAKEDEYDSTQVKENWKMLVENIQSIESAKERIANYQNELSELISMIENEEALTDILAKIDEIILKAWSD